MATLLAFVVLGSGALLSTAGARPPSTGNGAKRFDDLRELNNKLARAIKRVESEQPKKNSRLSDGELAQLNRTLKDLEVTKLRAVDQFPRVFGLPYRETFVRLSCVDEQLTTIQELVRGILPGHASGRRHFTGDAELYANKLFVELLKKAKDCKDQLEIGLQAAKSVPAGVVGDLRELNNKLARAIKRVESEQPKKNSRLSDGELAQLNRTLKDLEVTKLRAVDQFPEVLDPPYAETFVRLSCVDEQLTTIQELVRGILPGHASGRRHFTGDAELYANKLFVELLKKAKECKDLLEVDLLHSFDLKPTEQSEVGVNATTPNGTDTKKPSKLNAPKPLEHAYKRDGFVGRHQRDYVASGVNGGNPDSWPSGRNVLFFDVFDLFGSSKGARKAEHASENNLKSNGFKAVSDSSLGPGEAVFQKQPAGSPLLSTIIYVQRGTFIMKIAGSCKGCAQGSIESSLESVAKAQLAQAVRSGFPGPLPPPPASCSGHAMLANIYGGQAHQLVADFTCPKTSSEFSLTVPAGYQINGGQASNAASSGGYSCNLNSAMDTVDCTGNAPAGSTTYVQMTTSPNPQAGMKLELNVSFSGGSTTSFTLTSK